MLIKETRVGDVRVVFRLRLMSSARYGWTVRREGVAREDDQTHESRLTYANPSAALDAGAVVFESVLAVERARSAELGAPAGRDLAT